MIQVKFFSFQDADKCNEFIKIHRPRGEKGFVINTAGISVVYEDGEPMDKLEKLAKLKFQVGEHKEKILSYKKESLLEEAMQEEYLSRPKEEVNEYQKKKFKEDREAGLIAKKKMVVLEELSLKVTENLIKEIQSEK
jgi:hypothetical protein